MLTHFKGASTLLRLMGVDHSINYSTFDMSYLDGGGHRGAGSNPSTSLSLSRSYDSFRDSLIIPVSQSAVLIFLLNHLENSMGCLMKSFQSSCFINCI